jgi:peptidoglycan/xylan/chitin deacetylase (PgdA/CDA1 family)
LLKGGRPLSFWPSGRVGTVSLTFDDGLDSQLALAVPELDRRGLRATFYVNPSGSEDLPDVPSSWRERLLPWRTVHDTGHEIGNHSLLHPCSLNIETEHAWGIPNLRDWSLERIEADVHEAQRRLDEVLTSEHRTFAYPCYETSVGRGETRRSYVPFVARTFTAARAWGELSGSLANDAMHCDLHRLSSYPVERQSGAHMVGLAETATARGRWAIFTFHGIHEGALSAGLEDLVELLDFLDRRRMEIWTAPLGEVAAHVHGRIHTLGSV